VPTAANTWPLIHAEREAIIADLELLTEDQWRTPSLCGRWSVRDVVAHMTATAKMTPGRFIGKMAGAGFRFNAMTAKGVVAELGDTPADTLTRLKEHLPDTTHPPGPLEAMLGEAVVHTADIRLPLGIEHDYPADALIRVADFYRGSNLIVGGKKRAAGLTWKATDFDWTTGSGPEVSGPMLSIVLAITGRKAALNDLAGEGVETLSQRF
jgi:uncharacterized protein (TIGR03083 family)